MPPPSLQASLDASVAVAKDTNQKTDSTYKEMSKQAGKTYQTTATSSQNTIKALGTAAIAGSGTTVGPASSDDNFLVIPPTSTETTEESDAFDDDNNLQVDPTETEETTTTCKFLQFCCVGVSSDVEFSL